VGDGEDESFLIPCRRGRETELFVDWMDAGTITIIIIMYFIAIEEVPYIIRPTYLYIGIARQ